MAEPPRYPSSGDSGDDIDSLSMGDAAADDFAVSPNVNIKADEPALALDHESSGNQAADAADLDANDVARETMSPRAYQLEMLEKSLKGNVIVAMDTGSGKTQVAVLRIKAQLDMGHRRKMSWFLAPTVSLCEQQTEVIRSQIASTPIKLLTGNDNLETWSLDVWDAILDGVRIVVSTYQVLLDALDHAFVKMESLELLVIDEAHNCVRKHPCSMIMKNHYHTSKNAGAQVPAILGLTASPVMNSQLESMELLESTLDAKCTTPTLHREELLKRVKHPELSHAVYQSEELANYTPIIASLRQLYATMDITQDPYVYKLHADGSDKSRRELEKILENHDTFVQNQMKGLCNKSSEIRRQLGTWAADFYVARVIDEFLGREKPGDVFLDQWVNEERNHLASILRKVNLSPLTDAPSDPAEISHKAKVLVQQLSSVQGPTVGIVFVKERATVSGLASLLASSPTLRKNYQIGCMVGTSNYAARKRDIYDLHHKADLESLQNFRSGKVNLLIATSVLEEGIDIPACNLVICFDKPANLKVFIQRRGRARIRDSKLVLLLEENDESPRQWQKLEDEMKRKYEDNERELQQLQQLEQFEDSSSFSFITPGTGARLDFENAKKHLEHFCRVVPKGEHIDYRPDYIIHKDLVSGRPSLRATVILPNFLLPSLRKAESAQAWFSEKNATKDAAFQAYLALYHAGLVNQNLLPFQVNDIPGVEEILTELENEPSYSPWPQVARAWKVPGNRWIYPISLHNELDDALGHYSLTLPVYLPKLLNLTIFPNRDTQWRLIFGSGREISYEEERAMADHTSTLIALNFGHRWQVEDLEHVVKFTADEALSKSQVGALPFEPPRDPDSCPQDVLIRDPSHHPFLYVDMLPSKPTADQVQHLFYEFEKAATDVPYVVGKKWTKRSDFLHPPLGDPNQQIPTTKPYNWVLPLAEATVDTVHRRHVQFGMLIPSIIHEVEVMLVANELQCTLLQPVGLDDIGLIREAISPRMAKEWMDYERLEFLGDSILKYLVSIQVSASRPDWPEGYLSRYKDRLISNARLRRATHDTKLSKFILSNGFTGQKWRPLYVDNFLDVPPPAARPLPSKVMADVVEALIGASYKTGGSSLALKCIERFLHEVNWQDVVTSRNYLFNLAPQEVALPPTLEPLEVLLGYSFQKKSLLVEAMTHGSYTATDYRSFERLEFLGDAILDKLIVSKVFKQEPPLSHSNMHMLKTAMVNGDFLAFMCLEHALPGKEVIVGEDQKLQEKDVRYPLWKFMRHASPQIGIEQLSKEERFQSLRSEICSVMEHGTHYPWALLARLQARKYHSDLFEAVLGAVWIDSGSLEVCYGLLERFGILTYLERILRDNVNVQHPKEEIGAWVGSKTVEYRVDFSETIDGDREWFCKLMVDERCVVEVAGGVQREEVQTKAAEAALPILIRERQQEG